MRTIEPGRNMRTNPVEHAQSAHVEDKEKTDGQDGGDQPAPERHGKATSAAIRRMLISIASQPFTICIENNGLRIVVPPTATLGSKSETTEPAAWHRRPDRIVPGLLQCHSRHRDSSRAREVMPQRPRLPAGSVDPRAARQGPGPKVVPLHGLSPPPSHPPSPSDFKRLRVRCATLILGAPVWAAWARSFCRPSHTT